MVKNIIITVYLFLCLSAYSQIWVGDNYKSLYNDKLAPQTPEAALLIKNLSYPIDYNTGTVNIDIPIYEIKTNKLSFPLSISYKTGGIKFEEKNDLIGIGWKLNVTGVIIRKIKSFPDDCRFQEWKNREFYYNHPSFVSELQGFDEGLFDMEWDEYIYSFGKFSGKFIYDRNERKCIQFPLTHNIIKKTKNGFLIITQDGTNYYFEEKEKMRISCQSDIKYNLKDLNYGGIDFFNTYGGTYFWGLGQSEIAYYLTKITSLNELDSITFKYKDVDYKGSDSYKNINSYNCTVTSEIPLFFNITCDINSRGSSVISTYERDGRKKKVLTKIKFNTGHIDFITNENKETFNPYVVLSQINISNYNKKLKSVFFTHDLFKYYDKKTKRLRLDKVIIKGENNQLINKYKFNYYTDYSFPDVDCHPDTIWSQDKYGFYNGKCNTNSIYKGPYSGADRSSVFNYVQTLSLKSISEALGKQTVLYYEPNKFMKEEIGLRVKKIEETDLVSSKSKTTLLEYYKPSAYNFDETLKDEDFFDQQIKIIKCYKPIMDVYTSVYYPFPKIPGVNISDNHVRYNTVVEKIIDETHPYDTLKIKYEFEPYDNATFYSNPDYPFSPAYSLITGYFVPSPWNTSFLSSKTIFKYYNNEYTPLEVVENEYKIYNYDLVQTGLYLKANSYYCSLHKYSYLDKASRFNIMDIYASTGWKLPVRRTKKTYTDNGVIKETTLFKYDTKSDSEVDKGLLTEEIKYAHGQTIRKKYLYPKDGNIFNSASNVIATFELNRRGIQIPVSVSSYINNKEVSTNSIIYGDVHINYRPYILPDAIWNKKNNNIISGKEILKYDIYGNPIEINEIPSGLNKIFLWGYKGAYPVAEIQNASYDNVKQALGGVSLENFSELSNPNLNLINSLRNKLPLSHVSTFSYNPLVGLLSKTDARGISEEYEYDNVGRLSLIKDNYSNIRTSFQYGYTDVQSQYYSLYYNQPMSQTFYRNNCPEDRVGLPVTYSVPAGKYTSRYSIADANAKAQDEILENGQNYSNLKCECGFKVICKNNSNLGKSLKITHIEVYSEGWQNTALAPELIYTFDMNNQEEAEFAVAPGEYFIAVMFEDNDYSQSAIVLNCNGQTYCEDTTILDYQALFGGVIVDGELNIYIQTDCP